MDGSVKAKRAKKFLAQKNIKKEEQKLN